MKLAIGADHRGFALKEDLKLFLEAEGHTVEDVGAHVFDKNDDYPDFAYAAALLVSAGKAERGVLICGSGAGMDIAANKVSGIRATFAAHKEAARYGRDHDDINMITLAADVLDEDEAREIVLTFLQTPFSGEERHVRRIRKIAAIEGRE